MKKIEVKNFMWSTIASVFFGFTSLFYLIIVTRINGIDIAGAFTYAFANACVFFAIGSYSGKTFQITETDKNISDSDYLYNKLTTCFLMNIVAILFCIITHPGWLKTGLILILTFYRSIDGIIDSIHSIVQRNGELYKAGQSMFIRTFILIAVFLIIDLVTKNVILASLAILIINSLFCLCIDYQFIKNKMIKTKFTKNKNNLLLKVGFAVFLYSFLSSYLLNVTKYAINRYSSDEIQAIFGIIIMPASFLAMISQYLVQPFLNKITEKIQNEKKKELIQYIFSLSGFIIFVGICAIIFCFFLGIPILEFVYGISLNNQLQNLIIILIGSIFYSLVIIISSIFIALRKTFSQLFIISCTAILSIFLCNFFTYKYGIYGASISYAILFFLDFIFHFVGLIIILKNRKKKITIRLMGGLGNQMFQYAILRTMMLTYNMDGVISLKGITNKTHNVYSLNHFHTNNNVKIIKKESLKSKLNYLLYGFYCVFLVKKKSGYTIMKKIQPLLNKGGIYCVPDGYIPLSKSECVNNVMIGYYQSLKYFDKYKEIIKKELKVKTSILEENKKLLKEIQESNSVCVHIRRGDYVGTNHQVCDEKYYLDAIDVMNKKIKNAKFFIFSDDINWVKENIKFKQDVYFVEKQNPNYEDLRLMYTCKHFIISNSSYSWWAQYLTENENRITIAPKKWFQNENQKVDIFEDDWYLM